MTYPSKIDPWTTPEGRERIAAWAADGLTKTQIANRAGVDRSTFYRWLETRPEIALAYDRGHLFAGDDGEPAAPDWTARETRFLKLHAGAAPVSMIAETLHREERDVLEECARIGADAGYNGPALHWCPFCSQWRPHIVKGCKSVDRRGMCTVCARRYDLVAIEGRIADLLPMLTEGQRGIYEQTEAERESSRDPPPKTPRFFGMAKREEIAARAAFAAERSEWEEKQLNRRVKAAQKRKERIEKKVRACEPKIGADNGNQLLQREICNRNRLSQHGQRHPRRG